MAVSTAPSSPSGVSAGTDRVPGPRDLAALHRDVWTLVLRHPAVFLGLPLLAYLPFDLANEAALQAARGDPIHALLSYQRIQYLVSLLVGSYVTAALLEGVRIAGRGEVPTVRSALRGAGAAYGRVLTTTVLTGVSITVGLVFFVLPGVWLAVRYALAVPEAVYGRKTSSPRRVSADLVEKRGAFTVFAALLVGWSVYLVAPGLFVSTLAAWAWDPSGLAGVVWGALLAMPANAALAGLVIVAGLLHHEASGRFATALWPVGGALVDATGQRIPGPTSSGNLGLAAAALVGAMVMVVGVPPVALTLWGAVAPESYLAAVEGSAVLQRYVELIGD